MPHYPQTLDGMSRPYEPEEADQIIMQIMMALEPLHANKLVHMDIKPANIFIHINGEIALGDFGSVVPFGCSNIHTTFAFIPVDQRDNLQAQPLYDFLMLAMTVKSMVTPVHEAAVRQGPSDPKLEAVLKTLEDLKESHANALVHKIKESLQELKTLKTKTL
jgi:serine/threonine protein kinase